MWLMRSMKWPETTAVRPWFVTHVKNRIPTLLFTPLLFNTPASLPEDAGPCSHPRWIRFRENPIGYRRVAEGRIRQREGDRLSRNPWKLSYKYINSADELYSKLVYEGIKRVAYS